MLDLEHPCQTFSQREACRGLRAPCSPCSHAAPHPELIGAPSTSRHTRRTVGDQKIEAKKGDPSSCTVASRPRPAPIGFPDPVVASEGAAVFDHRRPSILPDGDVTLKPRSSASTTSKKTTSTRPAVSPLDGTWVWGSSTPSAAAAAAAAARSPHPLPEPWHHLNPLAQSLGIRAPFKKASIRLFHLSLPLNAAFHFLDAAADRFPFPLTRFFPGPARRESPSNPGLRLR